MGEYEEAKAFIQRKREAKRGTGVSRQMVTTDPVWGCLDKETWWGKVTLMQHHAFGQRYVPNDEVQTKLKKGWVVVEFTDPTKPRAKEPQPKEEEPVEPVVPTRKGR